MRFNTTLSHPIASAHIKQRASTSNKCCVAVHPVKSSTSPLYPSSSRDDIRPSQHIRGRGQATRSPGSPFEVPRDEDLLIARNDISLAGPLQMKDFYEQHNCIARFVRIHRADATGDGSNQPIQHLRDADKNWKAKQWQGSRPISVSSGSTRAAQLQPSGNNTARKLGRIRALLFLSIVLEDLSELFAHALKFSRRG